MVFFDRPCGKILFPQAGHISLPQEQACGQITTHDTSLLQAFISLFHLIIVLSKLPLRCMSQHVCFD